MNGKLIPALLLFLIGLFASSNAQTIGGTVFSNPDHQPLQFANIIIKGTDTGTVSDENGKFSLDTELPATILVQYVGFISVELKMETPVQDLEIFLESDMVNIPLCYILVYNDPFIRQAAAISILDREKLETGNETDYQQVLNSIPGVYMHSGALNTNRITVRGIGSRSLFGTSKIRAYLDEIPLTSGSGETSIEDIDPNLLESITLIKGPASSIYGSGLGGTFLLSSRNPEPDHSSLQSRFLAGSYGLIRSTTTISHESDDFTLHGSFNLTHSDGYRENNQYDRQSAFLLGRFNPSDKTRVSVLINQYHLKAFIPSSLDSTTFAENPEQAAFTWGRTKGNEDTEVTLAGISFSHDFSSQLSQQSSLFANLRESDEIRPFNILAEDSKSLGFRSVWNYQLFSSAIPQIRISAGTEFFRENYDWQTYENIEGRGNLGAILSDNQEIRRQWNGFTQILFKWGQGVRLTAGVNFNQTRYSLDDRFVQDSLDLSGDYNFTGIWSPRIAVNLPLRGDQLRLFAVVSHGFSNPTVEETLNPDGAVNPEILPEKGWNTEAGLRWQMTNDRLSGNLTVFSMWVTDLLVARRTGADQFVGVNAGNTHLLGVELESRLLIFRNRNFISLMALEQNYSYGRYRFRDFVDAENDYSGNQLTGSPANVLNTSLDLQLINGFFFESQLRYVDRIPVNDENSVFSDAYLLWNNKLGFKSDFGPFNFEVFAGMNNTTNTVYASMLQINASGFGNNAPRYYYPGLPRNFFGGISMKWTFRSGS